MSRVRRIVGSLLVAALACLAIVFLSTNLYVQSQTTQVRIQQELSQRLGMPLRIERISVTPWGGLKLSGITIRQSEEPAAPVFLQAKDFRLRVRFRSIFSRPLVIKEVALVHASVIWPQNDAGKWRVPSTKPPLLADGEPEEPQESIGLPATRPADPEASIAPEIRGNPVSASPQIRRVKLIDGSFHFLDRENKNVALFDGVHFSSALRESNAIRGETRIAHIALRDKFFLSDLRSPVRYDPSVLEFSAISAQVAKGRLGGSFSMQPEEQDSPFRVHAGFRQVQADELVAEAGGPRDIIRGVLEGTLDATGKTADPNALHGTGTISLRDGRVQQFPLLVAIGQLLQIDELTRLDLEQAEAKYSLAGDTVQIDDLTLRSANLRLVATGSVSFKGKLALQSTLEINEKVRAQLFRAIRDNFVATSEPGEYALQFHINGTVDRPKTDLVERAVGADLKDFNGVIDALLGRNKGKKKKNLNAATPIPSATNP